MGLSLWSAKLESRLRVRHRNDRKIRNPVPDFAGGLMLTFIGKMRVVVRKLAVIQLSRKSDRSDGILRNAHSIMRDIGSAGRNQADIEHAARLPGISLVDWIAVGVQLIRLVEVGARFNGPSPIVV